MIAVLIVIHIAIHNKQKHEEADGEAPPPGARLLNDVYIYT